MTVKELPIPEGSEISDALSEPLRLGAGVVKYYRVFRNAAHSYQVVSETLKGARNLPVLEHSVTLSGDEPETIVFDLSAILRQYADVDSRDTALKSILVPWHNYLVAQYHEALSRLYEYCTAFCSYFRIQVVPSPGDMASAGFEEMLQWVHRSFDEFSRVWDDYTSTTDLAERSATTDMRVSLESIDTDLRVSDILKLAGVDSEDVIRKVNENLVQGRTAFYEEALKPCLTNLTGAAKTLSQLLQKVPDAARATENPVTPVH